MAFRILTADEIALLTERQRKSYEEELAAYHERVRFVEQLEKQENISIAPYEPRLKKFATVKKAPERIYAAPEYQVTTQAIPTATAPEVVAVFEQAVTAKVPKQAALGPILVAQVRKSKTEAVILPELGKPVVPQITVGNMKHSAPAPVQNKQIVAPVLQADEFPAVECCLSKEMPTKVPKMNAAPSVSVNMPITQTAMETVAVPQLNNCSFAAPAPVCAKVPQVSVKERKVQEMTVNAEVTAKLPKVAPIQQLAIRLDVPKQMPVVVSMVSAPQAPAMDIAQPQFAKPLLPAADKLEMPVKTFAQVIVCADLKKIATPTVPAKTYSAPELRCSELHSAVATANFRKPAAIPKSPVKAKIDQPLVVKAPKPFFQKIHGSATTLPKRRIVSAPDLSSEEIVRKLQNPNA